MSFSSFEDTTAWAAAPPRAGGSRSGRGGAGDGGGVGDGDGDGDEGDIVASAMKKERVLRDISAAREDLKTLVARTQSVQSEVDKLTAGNQTLQMYIDNLTKQLARR